MTVVPHHRIHLSSCTGDRVHITNTLRLRVHACRETVCHNWFRESRFSKRWCTVARQNVGASDAFLTAQAPDREDGGRDRGLAYTSGVTETSVGHGRTGTKEVYLLVRANVTRRYADTCVSTNNSRCRHGNSVLSVPFSFIDYTKLSVGPEKKPRMKR